MAALGGCHVADRDLEEKLAARERRAATLPLLTGALASHDNLDRCAACELAGVCRICPASIGFSHQATGSDRNPAIQCDFNRLVEKHRLLFHRLVRERAAPG